MKIVFPYRFDLRFFFAKKILFWGITGGLSGKVFSLRVMNPNSEDFKRQKEQIDVFYYLGRSLNKDKK